MSADTVETTKVDLAARLESWADELTETRDDLAARGSMFVSPAMNTRIGWLRRAAERLRAAPPKEMTPALEEQIAFMESMAARQRERAAESEFEERDKHNYCAARLESHARALRAALSAALAPMTEPYAWAVEAGSDYRIRPHMSREDADFDADCIWRNHGRRARVVPLYAPAPLTTGEK